MFGANKNTSTFGNTNTSGFGASTQQPSVFGASTQQQSTFGSTTTQQPSAFGSTNTQQPSIFGANTQPQSAFGSSNSQQPSAFGTSTQQQSTFGNPNTQQPSAFGSNAQQSSAFGSNPQQPSTFGSSTQTSTGGFGTSSKPSIFGSVSQPATSFGTSTFGAVSQPSISQPAVSTGGSLFGSTSLTTSKPGGGLFSATNQTTAGSGGGLFGSTSQPATSTGGGLFGSTSTAPSAFGASTTGFGSFGTTANPSTGLFGSSTQNTSGFGTGMFGASQPSTGFGLNSVNAFNGSSNPAIQLPLFSIDEQDPWGKFDYLANLPLPAANNSSSTQTIGNGLQTSSAPVVPLASKGTVNEVTLDPSGSNQTSAIPGAQALVSPSTNILEPVGNLELTESFSLRPTDEVINQYFTNPKLLTMSHIFFKSVNFLDSEVLSSESDEDTQLSLEQVEELASEFDQLPLQMYPPFNRIRRRGLGSNSKVNRITIKHPHFGKCILEGPIEAAAFNYTTERDFLHQFRFSLASFDFTCNKWATEYLGSDIKLVVELNYVTYTENQDGTITSYQDWLESLEKSEGTIFISYSDVTKIWKFEYIMDGINETGIIVVE